MGGSIALTFRWSDGGEWRGSCWTNVLPRGLFSLDFYDEEKSEGHARKWLDGLLRSRKEDPDLEETWGAYDLLAPLEYGVVVVDYKTPAVLSANGYCSVLNRNALDIDLGRALQKRGLISRNNPAEVSALLSSEKEVPLVGFWTFDVDFWCPVTEMTDVDGTALDWVEALFKLSTRERKAWQKYLKERGR